MTLNNYHHMEKTGECNVSVRNVYASPKVSFHTMSDVKPAKTFIKPTLVFAETELESIRDMKVFIEDRVVLLEPTERIENLKSRKISYDDREQVWHLLFGNKPMPTIENNAVEHFCGILDREIQGDVQESDLRRIFRRARSKYAT